MAEKRRPSEAQVARAVEQVLAARLPRGWAERGRRGVAAGGARVDLVVEITAPSAEVVMLAIKAKRDLEPRSTRDVAARAAAGAARLGDRAVPIVAASYLSPRTRAVLDELGVGYVDTTGNVRIEVGSPGLFLLTNGADRDPWPQESELQSLRGRGAARAMRAIIDTAPPFGVRELAGATATSAPTISRVLDLLERDAIVTRERRGPILSVDWQAAIRRWSTDYDQVSSNTATMFLEARTLPALQKKLAASKIAYAATGAFAAQRYQPIAPARMATLYVERIEEAAEHLGLRETDSGANVMLLEPFDPVVFERTTERDGLRCVAPSQLAVDLLTGPGREPSQGEEILVWMNGNERAWRT